MIVTISTDNPNIEWGLVGKERIVQNVLNILRTKKYEVPFMHEMGVDTEYNDNVISYIKTNLENDIIELIEEYEDRVTILSVDIDGYDNNGNLIIKVELEV